MQSIKLSRSNINPYSINIKEKLKMANFAELNANELNATNGGSVSLPMLPIKAVLDVAAKVAAATSVAYTVYKVITK